MSSAPSNDLVGIEEASEILEVPVEQVETMAAQGLITPVEQDGQQRFRRDELLAARLQGG